MEGNQRSHLTLKRFTEIYSSWCHPQTRMLFSWTGFPTLFFLKLVMIAWMSVLIERESGVLHVALLSAYKEKSRTAALNKDMHRNQNEIRTCQLCNTVFLLSASSNMWSVYFFLGLINYLPWEFPLPCWIILALVIICTGVASPWKPGTSCLVGLAQWWSFNLGG